MKQSNFLIRSGSWKLSQPREGPLQLLARFLENYARIKTRRCALRDILLNGKRSTTQACWRTKRFQSVAFQFGRAMFLRQCSIPKSGQSQEKRMSASSALNAEVYRTAKFHAPLSTCLTITMMPPVLRRWSGQPDGTLPSLQP